VWGEYWSCVGSEECVNGSRDRGAHKVRKERAKEGINRPQGLVNYEIEQLDKMTILQDFDMRRSSRSDTLHEHIPDALPCFLHVFRAIADVPLRYRETCLICCTKMEARTQ
jgi:hypothetical protein